MQLCIKLVLVAVDSNTIETGGSDHAGFSQSQELLKDYRTGTPVDVPTTMTNGSQFVNRTWQWLQTRRICTYATCNDCMVQCGNGQHHEWKQPAPVQPFIEFLHIEGPLLIAICIHERPQPLVLLNPIQLRHHVLHLRRHQFTVTAASPHTL